MEGSSLNWITDIKNQISIRLLEDSIFKNFWGREIENHLRNQGKEIQIFETLDKARENRNKNLFLTPILR